MLRLKRHFKSGPLDPHQFPLDFAGDPGFAGGGEHVDLAADAELGKVDAGFDGEAGVGQDLALVVGFKVVEMRAGAVDFVGDVVAGAVGEPLGESGGANYVAGGIVGLKAADRLAGCERLLDGADGGIAGIAHGGEDELLAFGGFAANDARPGDVVEDGVGVIDAAPDVDEEEVAFLDFRRVPGGRLVVRIRAVGVDADVGSVFPDEAGALHAFAEPLHHVEFGDLPFTPIGGAQTAADFFPALLKDFVDGHLGDGVADDLLFREDGLELAYEVGGADDLLAEAAQEFNSAGIDHGDVHDVVVGRVLHGDPAEPVEHGLQTGRELLPAGIHALRSGQAFKPALLDAVYELARLAIAGDEVVPAARNVRLFVQPQDPGRNGIAVMVIVEEPAVVAGIAQRRLDRFQVHRRILPLPGKNAFSGRRGDGMATAMYVSTYSEWRVREKNEVNLKTQVIQGRYFADLMSQPEALEATWKGLNRVDIFEHLEKACSRERFQRIVLTGMGGSYFGLHPLCIELAANGWTPLMLETSELIHYYPHLLEPTTLVVAVSQSGKSAETVRLLELNEGRATVIGVTNRADSPLAQEADFAVLTAAGDEYSVSCKTYVSAQLALATLGTVLCGGNATERLQEMEAAPSLAAAYLADWENHVDELAEVLGDVRDVFLVGRGPSLAAALTGALTIKESAHFHSEGMSSAAFRHGPFEMLQAGILVGVFAGEPKTRALNDGLLRDLGGTPVRAVMFSEDAGRPACRLPLAAEGLRPIIEILPAQMMTLALAALKNREAGKFERATKVTVVE